MNKEDKLLKNYGLHECKKCGYNLVDNKHLFKENRKTLKKHYFGDTVLMISYICPICGFKNDAYLVLR